MDLDRIRNFSIIAHIDHGKSTLSDRILELTGAVDPRDMREQYLDSMDLERERGITIKAQNVRVDLAATTCSTSSTRPATSTSATRSSRSLAACEGVILLVDAAQGIEAQTLANCYLALENDLEIVAALNKIDLPAADPDRYADEIERVLGIPADEILRISAKTGEGVAELLDAVVDRIPPPAGDRRRAAAGAHLRLALRPVPRRRVSSVRVMNGTLTTGARLRFMQAGAMHDADEIGVRAARSPTPVAALGPGEVGYLIAGIKDVGEARSGETVTEAARPARRRSRATATPSRWCSAASTRSTATTSRDLREALEKLRLNDASVHLRARDVGRARLRLPLRLPRPAAHGDRARAARARVRPQPHRHRAVGRVPRAHAPTATIVEVDNPSDDADRPGDRRASRSRILTATILTPTDVHGHAHGAVPDPARRDGEARVPLARAGRARLPHPAGRGRRSTSSTS